MKIHMNQYLISEDTKIYIPQNTMDFVVAKWNEHVCLPRL